MIQTLGPSHSRTGFSLLDAGLAGNLPTVSHLLTLRITGWSMFPAIHKGDVIEVGPTDQITAGDVVIFQQADSLVCHRVVGIGPDDDIRTRGDHATRQDPPLRRQDILGRVTAVIRGGSRWPPTATAEASWTGVLRMRLDLLWTTLLNRLHDTMLDSATFLKRWVWLRNIATFALKSLVRFDVGIRVPLQTVRAYRYVPFHKVPPAACASNDLIVLARLGRFSLGTFDPASGELQMRRMAAGLGLEERLHDVTRRLHAAHAPASSGRGRQAQDRR